MSRRGLRKVQALDKNLRKLFGRFCLALPDDDMAPSGGGQVCRDAQIPRHIAGDLGLPIVLVGGWHAAPAAAVMPVPQAAMYEKRSAAGRKQQVWRAEDVPAVEAIAQAHGVGAAAHGQFGRCVA